MTDALHLIGAIVLAFSILELLLRALRRANGLRHSRANAWIATLGALAFVAPHLAGNNPMSPTQALRAPGMTAAQPSPYNILNDTYLQFLPWEAEVRRAFDEGRLPLWSDTIGAGTPIWSNPQAQPISPIAALTRFAPLDRFLPLGLALKMATAFRGTFWLARILGASRFAAGLGAASFSWGGGLLAWGLWPHGSTLAWLPWLLLSTIRLVRRPSGLRVAGTAVVTGIVLLSGYPVMAVLGGLLAAGCAIYFAKVRGRWRPWRPALAALAAVLGFALASIHILPFAETLQTSHRSAELEDYLAKREPTPPLLARWWKPPAHFTRFWRLAAVVHPQASGQPYAAGSDTRGPLDVTTYSGLVALLGSLLALLRRRRAAWPLLIYIALGLLIYGGWHPLNPWNEAFPESLFGLLFNFRFLPIVALSMSVCAAIGLSGLTERFVPYLALAFGALCTLAVHATPGLIGLWGLLALAIVVRRWPRIYRSLLLAVLVADLGSWSRHLIPPGQADRFFPSTPAIQEARAMAEEGRWRVIGYGYQAYPNLLSVYGLADVRYHDPLETERYREVLALLGFHGQEGFQYFSWMADIDKPLLDFLNVRGVFTSGKDHAPGGQRFQLAAFDTNPDWSLFENTKALPRFFLTSKVRVVPREQLLELLGELGDPARVLLELEQIGKADWAPPKLQQAYLPVVPESAQDGNLELVVPGKKIRLLATSVKGPLGWQARSDHGLLDTVRINHAFLGVIVPEDISRIHLVYRPPGLFLGAWLSLLAALTVLGLVFFPRNFNRRRADSNPSLRA